MELFKNVYEVAEAFFRYLYATEAGCPRTEITLEEIV